MSDFLDNSIIIAAHPDDEMLWFTSILPNVDRVMLVYEDAWPTPDIGPARARAMASHPHPNIDSLRVAEAATYGTASWLHPEISDHGIALTRNVAKRDAKQTALRLMGRSNAPAQGIAAHYAENYRVIVERLRLLLNAEMNVFTHNPWGEYGHEDHLQVFRAVDQMRGEIGFKLWMSNYCTQRALPLAMRYFTHGRHDIITLPADKAYADRVADCYRAAGCWTWSDDWAWFDTETFMEAPRGMAEPVEQGHLFPLNMFRI